MITSVKEILQKARAGGYAVGAFNTVNLETTRAILAAAHELNSPIIIQITEKTMDYAGGRLIFHVVKELSESYFPNVPVGIHLDHGKSFEAVERAIEIGFTSVMYDGSRKGYADNLAMTKKIADYCHEKGVEIQAEIGSVPYVGEGQILSDKDWDEYMTNPEQAKEFVEKTGVDALAVAIGNAHGFFKERHEPDYERLKKINELVDTPLILHGASDWENHRVEEVVKNGIACFNVDTAIRLAFVNSLVKATRDQNDISFDIRKLFGDAQDAVREVVKQKIKYFGSDGKI